MPIAEQTAVVTHPTPLGDLTLAASDEAVYYCGFASPEEVRRRLGAGADGSDGADGAGETGGALLKEARGQLDAYLDGRLFAFSLPVDLGLASDFVRRTVTALAELTGYGQTRTYGELAARIDRAGAARAVGTALGANPLCVIEPCHRILPASGRIGGYAGGSTAKEFLLRLEASHRL
ncbi:methylated-DNA--[protein]-cysteine S-methyltransferase [Streptomyces sp. NPDC088785]|uniref:methylated-DNA--[protein]-cysteine S-methyltransferase n=1 Tax=Streptomyces sp. NPDC088785 TaxID=3365897 RepID=UPI003819A99B